MSSVPHTERAGECPSWCAGGHAGNDGLDVFHATASVFIRDRHDTEVEVVVMETGAGGEVSALVCVGPGHAYLSEQGVEEAISALKQAKYVLTQLRETAAAF